MNPHDQIWRKSSYSQPEGPNCVEVSNKEERGIRVRDSTEKNISLSFSCTEWAAFIFHTKMNIS